MPAGATPALLFPGHGARPLTAVAGPLFEFHRRATDRLLLVRGEFRPEDGYRGFGGPVRAAGPSRPNEPTGRNR